jgi:competence protein ComEC
VIHILAVSGSNVGFVLIIFMGILGFLRLPYWWRVLVSLLGIIFYAYLTDLNPPVVRASIMGGFILLGKLIERKPDDFNTLALAALLILIFNPLDLFQASFQLSFAAVASIIYLYPKLKAATFVKSLYERLKEGAVLRYVFELLLVSTVAFLGTLPFTILYFNRIPNLSLPANLLVIPLAFLGLASGIAAAILNLLIPFLADIYTAAAWLFLHALIKLAEWAGAWPLAYFELYRFLFLHMVLYCIGLLLLFNLNQPAVKRWVWIYALVLANVFLWSGNDTLRNRLQVVFLDVGQGDAALVTFPDERHLLIDGGPQTPHSNAGKWVIAPYLKRAGIRKLDALVLSHADADHLGGFPYVMRHFKVSEVWDNGQQKDTALSREYLALIDSLKIRRRILRAGEMIADFAPANMFIMHPSERFLNHSGEKLNEGSLSLKLSYGAIDFLFTGDAELEGEQQIVQFGDLLHSEVLKVGHHGSRTSSSPILLESVRPQVAVISAGELNKFGHPHDEVLQRLHQLNSQVLRTDHDAAIILTTDGQELERVKWK